MQRTFKICLATAVFATCADALEISSELGRNRGGRGGIGRAPKTCEDQQARFIDYLEAMCDLIDGD